ncbi:ArsR/SmtB family transcription factor [Eupransor demetentiae]|uniref:ArsR family (ArsR) n=1 Tax=Eupransor demetentiae TaxID=3109584 RepID=A0ABM9N456_9LACO|nr:ArsR family (ArsR) [Lactobacillaceae bacterium LMG 33000]
MDKNISALKSDFQNLSGLLQALGDEKRQEIIIQLLGDESCSGLQVGELTSATGLSRPAVSHHLKILRDAELVDYRSEARKNFYYVCPKNEKLTQLQNFIGDVIQYTDRMEES